MKPFLAIAWREIHERRALLAAAAVASLLPVLAPLLPSTGTNPPEDIREAVMWVVLGGLAPLFAMLLGITFVGRDLSEGRMGFYYAQPISGPMIWFAKIVGVLVLVWLAELVIMLPTVVLSPDPRQFFFLANVLDPFVPKWVVPTLMGVVSLAVLLAAHAVGTIWRARSAWLVLDLLGLLFVIGLGWLSLRPFVSMALTVYTIGVWWLAIWLLIGFLAAGAVQMSAGRVDLRRSHRVLSATLWSIGCAAVVVLAVWSTWIRAAEPRDLEGVAAISVGGGEWIGIAGTSPFRFDYLPQFLFNVRDGRWLPVSCVRTWYGSYVRFSPDGTRVVWLERNGGEDARLWFADLTRAEVIPRRTEVVTGNDGNAFRVSSDGARAAFIADQMVSVFDVDRAKLIMVASFDEPFAPDRIRFATDDRLSVMASTSWKGNEGRRHRMFDVDLIERSVGEGTDVDSVWSWWDDRWTLRDDRKLHRIDEADHQRLVIIDPRTGDRIADLGLMRYWPPLRIVSGERIVRLVEDGVHRHLLRVFDFDGRIVDEIPIGRSKRVDMGGEPRSGMLMLGHYNSFLGTGKGGVDYLSSAVDLDSGEVVRIFTDLTPVLGNWGTWSNASAWTPGSIATRLLHGEDGSLHLWDPDSDELVQILPIAD